MINITMVVEYVFCHRFTYFETVAGLAQYEQKRGAVSAGKKYHKTSEAINRDYIPKNLDGKKVTSLKMYSSKHDFVGIVDHAIITDSQIIIVERKYSKYVKIYDTVRVQLGLLAVALEETFGKPVKVGILIYASNNTRKQVTVNIDEKMRKFALEMLEQTRQVIGDGLIPDASYGSKCHDCCYRKVCDVGSLNSAQ